MSQTYESMTTPEGRGREAVRPSEIPAPGWKDILKRVGKAIGDDRVLLVAAGVTFYLLLSFVPALAAFVSLYGLFADPATISEHLNDLRGIVPGGGMEIIEDQVKRLSEQGETTLGVTSLVSVAVALWSANAGVKALFEAMNVAYGEREKRNFLKLNAVSLAFTLGTIASILAFLGVGVVLPLLLNGLGDSAELAIQAVSLGVLAFLLVAALAALYRWGPSRENAKWRWITPGAVLTIIVTILASVLFTWYVANFGSYNATYGSLGTIVGFMTWIWITMIILIAGAEVNSETEHQTRRDSTTGAAQPMGARGARVADQPARGNGGAEPPSADGAQARPSTQPTHEFSAPVAVHHAPAPPRAEGVSFKTLAVALPIAMAVGWFKGRRSQPKD